MPVCKLCESDVKRTDKYFKCLFCYNKYHVKCLKYDEVDIKVLSKFNNCFIFEGSSKVDALRDSVDKCVTLVEQQSEKIKLQEAILNNLGK
jgi:transcription elongation factor Elf1